MPHLEILTEANIVACQGHFEGNMSAPQQQKLHTDDAKSVWNVIRSSGWSM